MTAIVLIGDIDVDNDNNNSIEIPIGSLFSNTPNKNGVVYVGYPNVIGFKPVKYEQHFDVEIHRDIDRENKL